MEVRSGGFPGNASDRITGWGIIAQFPFALFVFFEIIHSSWYNLRVPLSSVIFFLPIVTMHYFEDIRSVIYGAIPVMFVASVYL